MVGIAYSQTQTGPILYVFELSFCSQQYLGYCGKYDAAFLPSENSEPDELPVARPGASSGVTGAAQICGTMGGRIDMIA